MENKNQCSYCGSEIETPTSVCTKCNAKNVTFKRCAVCGVMSNFLLETEDGERVCTECVEDEGEVSRCRLCENIGRNYKDGMCSDCHDLAEREHDEEERTRKDSCGYLGINY